MELHPVYRISIYIPPDSLEDVIAAAEQETPLRLGPYEAVAHWSAAGTERFRPLLAADPTVGEPGVETRVPTILLELAVPRDAGLLRRVLDRLVAVHPWEEPAIFVDECTTTASPG